MLPPQARALGRSSVQGQAVLSGGAVFPFSVLLTLWAPASGDGRLLLAITWNTQDTCPRALGPEASFCAVWSELVQGGQWDRCVSLG